MYTHYVALGDSMSIDTYPSLDREQGYDTPAGAVSLFIANDGRYPGFKGRDLRSLYPGIITRNICFDGDTIGDVMRRLPILLPNLKQFPKPLITLTVGGNDFLDGLSEIAAGTLTWPALTRRISAEFSKLVTTLKRELPDADIILNTVYDPTDGTGILPGYTPKGVQLPLEYLHQFNDYVREFAGERIAVADPHVHFLGHGYTATDRDLWYWSHSIIEPGSKGASELRRLWLEQVEVLALVGPPRTRATRTATRYHTVAEGSGRGRHMTHLGADNGPH